MVPTPVKAQATGGCEPPPVTSGLSSPASWTRPEFYASGVVSATNVISPGNALGVEDGQMAVLTGTSVLTLSWPDTFNSGIAVWLYHPMEADCEYLWLYTAHYTDLAQQPLYTAANWAIGRGQWGLLGEYMAPFMPLHRYVVIRFNSLVYVDAVYYPNPPRRWWLPLVMVRY